MKFKPFTVGVMISLSAATFAKPLSSTMEEPWDPANDPDNFELSLDYTIGEIHPGPLANGRVARMPWSGHWFPAAQGFAAVRPSEIYYDANANAALVQWQTERDGAGNTLYRGKPLAPAFSRGHYAVEELIRYSNHVGINGNESSGVELYEGGILEKLAPSEKLDIAQGHADSKSATFYKNTNEMLDEARAILWNYPQASKWAGLCNGYSSAAIYTPEPRSVKRLSKVYTLANGRKVQFQILFYSGDLKALSTYIYAKNTSGPSANMPEMVGARCNTISGMGCRGINAGSFHVILTNLIGRRKEAFVVDRDWTDAVWNYPVVSYRVKQFALRPYRNQDGSPTKWARPDAASGATHGARVVLEVDYLNESYFSYQPLKETNSDHIETFTYEYELELAAGADGVQGTKDDVILGGEWISRNRPDFAWKLHRPFRFRDDYFLVDPQAQDRAWIPSWQEAEWEKYWHTLR